MKKLLTFALTLILVSALVLPVSATDVLAPTVEEVEKLITDSYDMFLNIYGWWTGDEFIDVVLCYENGNTANSTAAIRKESADYSYWIEKSKSLYTDDVAEDMLFLLNNAVKFNDKFYVVFDARMDPHFSIFEGAGAYSDANVDIPGFDGDLKITFDEKMGDEIVAHFSYRKVYFEVGEEVDLRTSVNLKYENGKWQISGGEYIELMEEYNSFAGVEEIKVTSAPATSLTTAVYAAVAALALGVVVVKKKH